MELVVIAVCIIGFTLLITYWFLPGRLNPMIDAGIGIAKIAVHAMLTVLFGAMSLWIEGIEKHIAKPIRRIIQKIHIPFGVIVACSLILGLSVVALDHQYGRQLFLSDETIPFYHITIMEQSYWISWYALSIGGFLIGYSLLAILLAILEGVLSLLNQPVRISVIVRG